MPAINSSTTRKSGTVTLAKGGAMGGAGETYEITGVDLTKTSGVLHVWGTGASGSPYGGFFHWIKGVTAGKLGTEEGALPFGIGAGVADNDFSYAGMSNKTYYKKDNASTLNVYFDAGALYLQNGNPIAGENITVCWDATIITH